MTNSQTPVPGPQMVRIDGLKIRQIREELGLTQLYVATAVGVTTDTISRWENRRYPSIKRENALKLAETLDLTLDDLQETEAEAEMPDAETEVGPASGPPGEAAPQAPPRPSRPMRLIGLAIVLALGIAVSLGLWLYGRSRPAPVVAVRWIPSHAAPGQVFPVIVETEKASEAPLSLILEDAIPRLCQLVDASPPPTAQDKAPSELKWITQMKAHRMTVAFTLHLSPSAPMNDKLRFSGSVIQREGRSSLPVSGPDILTVQPFHWADTNADGRIDDQEILTVYDELALAPGLDFDKTEIERIWLEGHYRWNPKTKKFDTEQSTPQAGPTPPS